MNKYTMNHTKSRNTESNWGRPRPVETFPARGSRFPTPPLDLVGSTSDGTPVHNRPNSHLHLTTNLLQEALSHVTPNGAPFHRQLVDLGRIIGSTECVPTTDSDKIIFASRPGRSGLTRFVLNRDPLPCSSVVVVLKKREDGFNGYIVVTAFIGKLPEPEPWDRFATPAARQFWLTHALIYNPATITPGTEQEQCPW
jgi:hypothetical protein